MSSTTPAKSISLVTNAASPYVIVIAQKASPSERFAATELADVLESLSGCRLPVVNVADVPERQKQMILLGDSAKLKQIGCQEDIQALGDEDFVVRTVDDNLVLAGGRLRGSMYAVYTFLEEKLGCRWYSSQVSLLPRSDSISIGEINEKHRPAFEYREPYYLDAFDGNWAARNRCNSNRAALDDKRGGRIQYHGFVHTFYPLVPPDKYFDSHPEYYSLIDGKRTTERAQLCLTNPEVLEIVTQEVLRWMETNPQATIFSVSQNDWFGACQCDQCRKIDEEEGSHAGTLIRFVNAVAEEAAKRYPDKYIDTLAYQYTEKTPRYAKPHSNVIVRLCHMRPCCDSHPLDECPENASYCQNLQQWTAITDKVYIWHYVTNFKHYLMPFPNFRALGKDMAFYHNAGVAGMFCQGNYNSAGGELAELRAWVLAKLLWNPHQDINPLIDDFLAGYYGPAAGYIRDYIDLLVSKVTDDRIHMDLFCDPDAGYLTPGIRAQAADLLQQAVRAATSEDVRLRVERIQLGLEYVDLWYEMKDAGGFSAIQDRLGDYVKRLKRHGIERLTEWQTLDELMSQVNTGSSQ